MRGMHVQASIICTHLKTSAQQQQHHRRHRQMCAVLRRDWGAAGVRDYVRTMFLKVKLYAERAESVSSSLLSSDIGPGPRAKRERER